MRGSRSDCLVERGPSGTWALGPVLPPLRVMKGPGMIPGPLHDGCGFDIEATGRVFPRNLDPHHHVGGAPEGKPTRRVDRDDFDGRPRPQHLLKCDDCLHASKMHAETMMLTR